ncbi:MAG: peptide chain release factor 1 [Candidatus Alcyoniella australis]|nr:peptide chain release factor 1 [Candidatus Alcyoniella australis]
MLSKLHEVEQRYEEVNQQLSDPAVISDLKELRRLGKEHSDLEPIVQGFRVWKQVDARLAEAEVLREDSDPEIRELAQEEVEQLKEQRTKVEHDLRMLLLPTDPLDEKDVILEIRAGTGGGEAALFAADLLRMYTRYSEERRWKIEVLSANETGIGGLKEVICQMHGKRVYSRMKYESGVHRVQRVPETESQGRIHTSACTVAILPEADEVDVKIAEGDLRFDVYRSSGPGGQSVNTTDSAVRVTHLPSGLVVTCQDEKSQHKNKARALKILRSRLFDRAAQEQHQEIAANRRSQVGSGDRSERIRTYNFPQNRLTDHRIGLTLYRLGEVMEGRLDQVIDPLITYFQAEALKANQG